MASWTSRYYRLLNFCVAFAKLRLPQRHLLSPGGIKLLEGHDRVALGHMNGRLVRKTLGYSKELEILEASSIWEDAVYNLGRALKSLRVESQEGSGRRWIRRSPAMAAGLTDHIWEIEELLSVLLLPSTNT